MKRFICILCFLSSLCSCSPLGDELSDDLQDDLTYRLEWAGDIDKFKIDREEGLRLDDKQEAAGSAFLVTPSTQIRGTRWEFRAHLFFNPSANNYARFYLAASSDHLSGALDGYFLQIGGAKDCVSLCRQDGLEVVLLATGREVMKSNNSPDLKLKVECDDNGYWTFWTCLKGEPDYVLEKQVRDETFTASVCAGVCCFYTATRCNGFIFSHIRMTHDVETTTKPEEPETPDQPELPEEPEQEGLLFNEVMYHNGKDGVEYIELYNNSQKYISLLGIHMEKQKVDGTPINGGRIALTNGTSNPSGIDPGTYLCFTTSAKELQKKHQVEKTTLVDLSGFPPLNDKGGVLVLLSAEGQVIDRCFFSDDLHTISKKKAIGVSLEKRSPSLVSDKAINWLSSKNKTGGTPGIRNSVAN